MARHRWRYANHNFHGIFTSHVTYRYFNTFLSDQAFVTVMEYIPGVDLSRAIKRQRGLKEEQIRLIMAQLGLALNHMHLKGFIHRDIKVTSHNFRVAAMIMAVEADSHRRVSSPRT